MTKPVDLSEWARPTANLLVDAIRESGWGVSPEAHEAILSRISEAGESLVRRCAEIARHASPHRKWAETTADDILRSFQLTKEGEDATLLSE